MQHAKYAYKKTDTNTKIRRDTLHRIIQDNDTLD